MKILVAPLNWGLGHASRCIPLIQRFLTEGHEVILGGDGDSLTLLRKHFPKLRFVYLAPLNLQYSRGSRQVFAMLRALPKLFSWAIKDHAILRAVLEEESFDQVISDNRFGFYNKNVKCVYLTHQLHIMFPKGWRWLEPLVERLHARIYRHFNEIWVPDYKEKEKSLAGELSHIKIEITKIKTLKYIGPLSRFEITKSNHHEISDTYDVVAVLSGLEPHRSFLERDITTRFSGKEERVLIVQGLMSRPYTRIKRGNITIVPYLNDIELTSALLNARHVIARSGYSTIMDIDTLGLINHKSKKIELIPTPGQPEQEYLAQLISTRLEKFRWK